MNTENAKYLYAEGISAKLERKRIRNVYVSINSVTGEVSVSVSLRYSEAAAEEFFKSKLKWIKKHKTEIDARPKPVKNEYFPGEKILLFGKEYELKVYEYGKSPKVFASFDTVDLYIKKGASREERKKAIEGFYEERLKKEVVPFAAKWEEKLGIKTERNPIRFGFEKIKNAVSVCAKNGSIDDEKVVLVRPVTINFKVMKGKWGSCNISSKKITLNTELAKKSLRCVEYVTAHELLHLKEIRHNKRFKDYMKKAFPDWKKLENALKIID